MPLGFEPLSDIAYHDQHHSVSLRQKTCLKPSLHVIAMCGEALHQPPIDHFAQGTASLIGNLRWEGLLDRPANE